jgi:hypothetical protein
MDSNVLDLDPLPEFELPVAADLLDEWMDWTSISPVEE